MTTLNTRKKNVNINMSTEREARGPLFRIPDDVHVANLELINNFKDFNRWETIFNCIHVREDEEDLIEFGEIEWILCRNCVMRLGEFLLWMNEDWK